MGHLRRGDADLHHDNGEHRATPASTRGSVLTAHERRLRAHLDLHEFEDYVSDFVDGYVTCALWSSTDDNEEPLDAKYDDSDIWAASYAEMRSECEDFVQQNWSYLTAAAQVPEYADTPACTSAARAGHDFWLTRNGHGAGFWDRGLGDLGDRLTEASKAYGGCDLYVGDNGMIYVS